MGKLKTLAICVPTLLAGLLLVLAGFNLVELSLNLLLYIGILLIVLSVVTYFLDNKSKKEVI